MSYRRAERTLRESGPDFSTVASTLNLSTCPPNIHFLLQGRIKEFQSWKVKELFFFVRGSRKVPKLNPLRELAKYIDS